MSTSVTVAFGIVHIFSTSRRTSDPGSVQCLVRQWIHALRQFRGFLADVPVVHVVQVLMGAVVEETVELRRLHSSRNFPRWAVHQRVDELMG